MRKPSIFSKDYEKIMRKRRRVFAGIISLLILVCCLALATARLKIINGNIVSWVKEDDKEHQNVEDNDKGNVEKIDVVEVNSERDNSTAIDIFLNDNLVTVLCKEVNGDKIISDISNSDNIIFYKLDYTKKKAVIIDKNQDMFLCDVNGKVKDLSLKEYIAPNGDIYDKNTNISLYEDYLWHSQGYFIDDNRIAYVSNLPYFGYNLNQYVQVVNIDSGIHETIWWTKGYNIILKESETGGLEANIDGNIKYIK